MQLAIQKQCVVVLVSEETGRLSLFTPFCVYTEDDLTSDFGDGITCTFEQEHRHASQEYVAVTDYDGQEMNDHGFSEGGYLAVSRGDRVVVQTVRPYPMHEGNRFDRYVFAHMLGDEARRGWIPVVVLEKFVQWGGPSFVPHEQNDVVLLRSIQHIVRPPGIATETPPMIACLMFDLKVASPCDASPAGCVGLSWRSEQPLSLKPATLSHPYEGADLTLAWVASVGRGEPGNLESFVQGFGGQALGVTGLPSPAMTVQRQDLHTEMMASPGLWISTNRDTYKLECLDTLHFDSWNKIEVRIGSHVSRRHRVIVYLNGIQTQIFGSFDRSSGRCIVAPLSTPIRFEAHTALGGAGRRHCQVWSEGVVFGEVSNLEVWGSVEEADE